MRSALLMVGKAFEKIGVINVVLDGISNGIVPFWLCGDREAV